MSLYMGTKGDLLCAEGVRRGGRGDGGGGCRSREWWGPR